MGTQTTGLGLYKPTVGETGWAPSVNGNFDTLEATIGLGGGHVYARCAAGNSGATNRGIIQAAHDALPAAGGRINLPGAEFPVDNTPVVVSKPCHLQGHGMSATILNRASGNAPLLTVAPGQSALLQTPGTACVVEDVQFKMSGTTATGILVDPGGANLNEFTRINRCRFVGGSTGIEVLRAHACYITHCDFTGFTTKGVGLANISNPPTSGDQGEYVVAFNSFVASGLTAAGVAWTSGGALKLFGNMMNSVAQGLYAFIDAGVSSAGANIIGNDIGAQPPGGVAIQFEGTASGPGSGHYGEITICGNHLGGDSHAIRISHLTANGFVGVTIVGNSLIVVGDNVNAVALFMNNVLTGMVSANQFTAHIGSLQGLWQVTNCAGVTISNSQWLPTASTNLFRGTTYCLFQLAPGVPFASLPAAEDGSMVYVPNGTVNSSPLTGGGNGAIAKRLGGIWRAD